MFTNIWKSCLGKNYRQINEYEKPNPRNIELIKKEREPWQDIYNLYCVEENELSNEEFILEKRIKNICLRWNIKRFDAYLLIRNVEKLQNSNQDNIQIESDSENENENENESENQVKSDNENYC